MISHRPKRRSLIAKRSVFIGPRKSSVSIEAPFWEALKEIAAAENLSLGKLTTRINGERQTPNLSSAIRQYVLDHYRRLVDQALAGGRRGGGDFGRSRTAALD